MLVLVVDERDNGIPNRTTQWVFGSLFNRYCGYWPVPESIWAVHMQKRDGWQADHVLGCL